MVKTTYLEKLWPLKWNHLHENRDVKLFSQLQDECISLSSKQGPSHTGPAKPPNLPKNRQIWWFGQTCVARPLLGWWWNMLILELTEWFYVPVVMEAISCRGHNFSKIVFTASVIRVLVSCMYFLIILIGLQEWIFYYYFSKLRQSNHKLLILRSRMRSISR